ncbi:MAG: DUF2273 domain-containing protein [Candidatus Limiplasma sp.]|nr:DUF2273 domain-containing protein [Candidatus Limiplasma sp.]
MMDSQSKNNWFNIGTPKCGLLLGACGIAIAFMLIFLGFWNTVLVIALFLLGYWFGAIQGKSSAIKNFINKVFPPKGE